MEREYVDALYRLCMDINSNDNVPATAFFELAGHVNSVTIRVHKSGWHANTKCDYNWVLYFDDELFEAKDFLEAIVTLVSLLQEGVGV